MKPTIVIRPVTVNDIPELIKLRRIMFEAMGYCDSAQLNLMEEAAKGYFIKSIPSNEFYGWLAIDSEKAIAAGGLCFDKHPPTPSNLSGKIGYIMNLVTIPPYRNQGIATCILMKILEHIKILGIENVSLHATEAGKSLYQKLGFRISNEMLLIIKD